MDDQVKIDGFRIELAEIEVVFMQDTKIERAVALVRNGRLALYIKYHDKDTVIDRAAIKAMMTAAARSLTHYMMPK